MSPLQRSVFLPCTLFAVLCFCLMGQGNDVFWFWSLGFFCKSKSVTTLISAVHLTSPQMHTVVDLLLKALEG